MNKKCQSISTLEVMQSPTENCNKSSTLKKITEIVNEKFEKNSSADILASPIECEVCSTVFKNNVAFAFHSINHSKEQKYSCHLCEYVTPNKDQLKRHVQIHERSTKCEYCAKSFTTYNYLHSHKMKVHYELVTGKPKYYCGICEKSFKYDSTFKHHNTTYHNASNPEGSVPCVECGKSFANKESLVVHSEIHSKDKPFTCSFCGKGCARAGDLKVHERVHTGEKPYICKFCGKRFFRASAKKIHEKIHTGQDRENEKSKRNASSDISVSPIECEICSSVFKNNVSFALHSIIHSPEQKYSCHLCNKYKTQNKDHLKKHVRVHERSTKCEICNKVFRVTKDAQEHKKYFHTGEKPFSCECCAKSFTTSNSLHSHKMKVHYEHTTGKPAKKHFCAVCNKYFRSLDKLKYHNITNHNAHKSEQSVLCVECGKIFASRESLVLHITIHSRDKSFICSFCGKGFTRAAYLRDHERVHTGEKPYICKICGKGFSQRTSMKIHEKIHTKQGKRRKKEIPKKKRKKINRSDEDPDFETAIKTEDTLEGEIDPFQDIDDVIAKNKRRRRRRKAEKPQKVTERKIRKKPKRETHPPPIELDEPIECDICNETYKNNVAFAIHSIRHSDDNKYNCHLCDFKNTSKYHIEMHVRAHEGTTNYKCEICNKAFTVSTNAIEHKYFHTGEKPFRCEICGKNFMFSRFLASHRRTQHWEIMTGTPLVKYDCTICNKHYTSSSGLKRHNLRNHNTEGIDVSVLCDTCGKRISSKEKLKFHMRIHTGYKPFSCEVCGKAFSEKERLKEHMRVHTGEKPFVCKYCNKAFTQRSPLKIHERSHTGEMPYICRICDKRFVSKSAMDAHMKNCSALQIPNYTTRPPAMFNMDYGYMCKMCEKHFPNKILLESHLISHNTMVQPEIPENNRRLFESQVMPQQPANEFHMEPRESEVKMEYQDSAERRLLELQLHQMFEQDQQMRLAVQKRVDYNAISQIRDIKDSVNMNI